MTMPARFIHLHFICLLTGLMLLGLTRRAFAYDCTKYDFSSGGSYSSASAANNAMIASKPDSTYSTYGGFSASGSIAYECLGIPVGIMFYEYYKYIVRDGKSVQTGVYFMADPSCTDANADGKCDDTSCSDERAAAESQCGGPDLYVIDEETCEWHCDDSQDCPDSDDDGAADVCDPCPDNPEISEDSVQIYRLNGDAEKCGESTMSCDGSTKFEGNTGTICQAAEVEVTECRAVRGSGAECKADKDTDGDGTYDSEDEDDDNDGTPDSEDTDDDGDGIPDVDDKDHEDYSDYDNDGIPDYKDTDDDNDGTPDGQDKCPRNPDPNCEDSDGDDIPDSEDTDDDGDGTPDSEDPDDDGDGIPDEDELNPFPEPDPFTLELDVAALFQKYLDRFSQFLASMRQTSVFSIPNQVLGGIPSSGGSPVVTISTGETFGGDHQIDFSGWASGLAVIRGVLYAVFTALAVRIIILKR